MLNDYLANPSFEQPGTTKINQGFDSPTYGGSQADVPGWNSSQLWQDSGVENSWVKPIPNGDWAAYLMGSEGPVWQTSSLVMAAGDTITLDYYLANTGTWWSVGNGDAGTPIPLVMLYADNGLNRITLAVDMPSLVGTGNTWQQFSISYTVDAGFAGYNIGVLFDNLNGFGMGGTPPWENNTWMGVDMIPEPATIPCWVLAD